MKVFSVLTILFATILAALAQQTSYVSSEVTVGEGPIMMFQEIDTVTFETPTDEVYVICQGIDINFNGVQEEEDTKASIWRIFDDGTSESIQEIDGFFPKFPLKTLCIGVDLMIPMTNGKVYAFDYETEKLSSDPVSDIDADAIFAVVDGENKISMFLSSNPVSESSITIEVNGFPIIVPAGTNATELQMVGISADGNFYLATLNHDGSYENWTVQIGELIVGLTTTWEYTSIPIGDTPNSVVISPEVVETNEFFVIGNGSHEIYEFNSESKELLTTTPVFTTGFGGPRNGWYLTDSILAISTYSSKMLLMNVNTKEIIEIEATNLGEGIYGNEELIMLAMPFKADYSANNTVGLFQKASGVESTEQYKMSINPSFLSHSSSITSEDLKVDEYTIISLNGEIIGKGKMQTGKGIISREMFQNTGLYRVIVGNSSRWVVVK